jgi:hypothetical protein
MYITGHEYTRNKEQSHLYPQAVQLESPKYCMYTKESFKVTEIIWSASCFPTHTNTHQFKIPKLHKYFDNQENTIPIQSVGKNCTPSFHRDKTFTEDRNGNRLLSRQKYWNSYN